VEARIPSAVSKSSESDEKGDMKPQSNGQTRIAKPKTGHDFNTMTKPNLTVADEEQSVRSIVPMLNFGKSLKKEESTQRSH
jgi:hypothetical protein